MSKQEKQLFLRVCAEPNLADSRSYQYACLFVFFHPNDFLRTCFVQKSATNYEYTNHEVLSEFVLFFLYLC